MSPKTISCILFDFDGVLIDSEPAMNIAWNSVQEKYGVKKNFFEYSCSIFKKFTLVYIDINCIRNSERAAYYFNTKTF